MARPFRRRRNRGCRLTLQRTRSDVLRHASDSLNEIVAAMLNRFHPAEN